MTSRPPHPPLPAPAVRVTVYSALYFAGLSGVLLFLPVWFEKARNLSGARIGAILAAAGFGRMILGPLVAGWADGRRDRHAPIKLLAIAALTLFLLLGAVPGYWFLLACGFVAVTSYWLMVGYVEAALMRLASGRLRYPVARAVGSAAFIGGSLAVGRGISAVGPVAALAFVVAMAAALVVGAWWLAPEWTHRVPDGPPLHTRLRTGLDLVRDPAFALLLVGAGVVQASHAFYNAFGGLVWLRDGLSGSWVGLLFGVGVGVEVLFLGALGMWSERFRPTALVLAGALGAVLRWAILATRPPLPALVPLQALHGLSFAATYLGTMRLIHSWYGVERAPTAQMMYQSFAAAPLAATATLASGPLYDAFGARGYWGMVGLAAAGAFLALRLRRESRPTEAEA